jgi:hypothetical protein
MDDQTKTASPADLRSAVSSAIFSLKENGSAIAISAYTLVILSGAVAEHDDDLGLSIQRLAWEIKRHAEALQTAEGELFDAINPDAEALRAARYAKAEEEA